jgi:hypothetical protein
MNFFLKNKVISILVGIFCLASCVMDSFNHILNFKNGSTITIRVYFSYNPNIENIKPNDQHYILKKDQIIYPYDTDILDNKNGKIKGRFYIHIFKEDSFNINNIKSFYLKKITILNDTLNSTTLIKFE